MCQRKSFQERKWHCLKLNVDKTLEAVNILQILLRPFLNILTHLKPCQTSKMQFFVKKIQRLKPGYYFCKNSFIDVWQGSEYPSWFSWIFMTRNLLNLLIGCLRWSNVDWRNGWNAKGNFAALQVCNFKQNIEKILFDCGI